MEHDTKYRSAAVDLLYAALAKAQGDYKPLIPNEESSSGKYANLQAIHDATRQATSANQLNLHYHLELLDEGSGAAILHTTLGHSSGQYITSCARVIAGKTDRQTGNALEHHKRIHSLMLLGIAPSKNDPIAFDDNGIEQMETYTLDQLKKSKDRRPDFAGEVINKDQYNDLLIELEGYPQIAKDIMEVFNIETLADLPKEHYHPSLQRIRRIKRTEEDYLKKRS